MTEESRYQLIRKMVFDASGLPTFAVLDGALIPGLPGRLLQDAPDALCLFIGDLEPSLAAAAPYVVPLRPAGAVSAMVLREGWHADWGIILSADPGTDVHAIRNHLRRILHVPPVGAAPRLFRFYDPRAFRTVVPGFGPNQYRALFGPIVRWLIPDGDTLLDFRRGGASRPIRIPLASAA